MSTGPAVAKTVWTEADFGAMGWHDNAIHAVAAEPGPDQLFIDDISRSGPGERESYRR